MQEERVVRHKRPVRRVVHVVPRRVVDVRHQLLAALALPRAEPPADDVDADRAVARGARQGAPAHQRVGEAALARALLAEQHQLHQVARRGPAAQVAQEGQHRVGPRGHHARRRRVQGRAFRQIQLPQARERPELRRQRRQPGAGGQIQLPQARERPELRRQRRQPAAVHEQQVLQPRERREPLRQRLHSWAVSQLQRAQLRQLRHRVWQLLQ